MAVGQIINVDWLNENAMRRYPFYDAATMMDSASTMEVPNSFIADMQLSVPWNLLSATLYVSKLLIASTGVTVTISRASDSAAIATCTIVQTDSTKTFAIVGTDSWSEVTGTITIWTLADLLKYGGEYTFSSTAARLLPTIARPALRGVDSLRVVTADNEQSELLRGDLEIVAGANVSFSEAGGVLAMNAVDSNDYTAPCSCTNAIAGSAIKTINNVGPDPVTGDFTIAGSDCLVVDPGSAGITLRDVCAQPCCGCEELTVLRNETIKLGNELSTQKALAQRMLSSIENLRDVVLASKLGTAAAPCAGGG